MLIAAVVLALAAPLAACGGKHGRPPCATGSLCLLYGNGAEPETLDPNHFDGTWEAAIVSELIVGLTVRDAEGEPIPGMATSWTTSADGLTWTFHLRDALWSDGTPVTADDFVYGIRRELNPKTAAFSAFILYPILKNAEAVNAGKLPLTAAGVEAPDPHTVVIHLEHPWPNLPYYVSGRIFWPIPQHVVERWGESWTRPGRYVGNGPYTLVSWKLGDKVVVKKNPLFWDADHVCYKEIDYFPTTDAISNERRVRSGELDLTTTVQSNRLSFLRRSGMANFLRVAPYWGVTYLTFNVQDPALRDVRVRQALSMAIDREFITGKLLRGGQTPAYSFVPPGVSGYAGGPQVYWSGWSLARRQAEARRLLAEAGYGPAHPLKFEVKHRNSPDPMLFLPAIQSDWKDIGVDASLRENEVQVAYQAYESHDYQVGDAGWVSEDPMVYLDLARSTTGGMNYGSYVNHAYDSELDAALATADPGVRAQHMRSAEQMLLADMPNAPLFYISSRNLVDPKIVGWVDNPIDTHQIRWLCHAPLPTAPVAAAAS
ncbi:MAG: peptide ABC transporter substrate-binding protein [Caulobacterales bacterium]